MAFTQYDLRNCCPDLNLECNEITPLVDIYPTPPGPLLNDGTILVVFRGLLTTYRVALAAGNFQTIQNQVLYQNLEAGLYTIRIASTTNPECLWELAVRVPAWTELDLELYYRNFFTFPVPSLPNPPFNILNTALFPDDYRYNFDRIIIPGQNGPVPQNGFNICFTLQINGGVQPYNIVWEDFNQYIVVPPQFITPITPAQALNNPNNNQRPPILNGVNGTQDMCFNLTPNNGNGWVRVTVTDSSPIALVKRIWIYLMEAVLP